jgi:aryl-alcohol dehydrogenase-like predicted oxidoreductase
MLYERTEAADSQVIAAVQIVALEVDRSMAQVALAWVRQKPGVVALIVGYSRPDQFADILSGLDLVLTAEQVARLEAAYVPRTPAGH